MLETAVWITAPAQVRNACPVFRRCFSAGKQIRRAELTITARGVYEVVLNGRRVGAFLLAPGWTEYETRIQVQCYDVSTLLAAENTLEITLASGWYNGRIANCVFSPAPATNLSRTGAVLAALHIEYADATTETIVTNADWLCAEGPLRTCDLYDGQCYDATFVPEQFVPVAEADFPKNVLVPQIGEEIRAQEILTAHRIFTTPNGETVVDFGQNLTGVPEIHLHNAPSGAKVRLSFAEILDSDGNFYTENYRSAKAEFEYICTAGAQTYRPTLTFYGFRYIRVDAFPGTIEKGSIRAVVIHSQLRQTGFIHTGDAMLNRLFSNILWGQKGNYVDVPTDCPQRDERYGWTGDAQVFVKAASYNFDVERFFTKWLGDLAIAQQNYKTVPDVVPAAFTNNRGSAAWGDAATVCPWQIYMTYGNPAILEAQFDSMRAWVDYITQDTIQPDAWRKANPELHYADWLGLDAPYGQYKGSSDPNLIASAFYAYSTALLVRAGQVIGRDMHEYEALHTRIVWKFQDTYRDTFRTQTEHALALHFGLAKEPAKVAASLAELVRRDGEHLMTGFVGTPYILHALSDNGYADLAYTLLLRREFPSWLYPVTQGATTMWEHWDGIRPDGQIWSADMNSYNHYAYGAVADWIYEKAAGIQPAQPGFAKVQFAPLPDARLGSLHVCFESRYGRIESSWRCEDDVTIRYRLVTPVSADACIEGREYKLTPGVWEF